MRLLGLYLFVLLSAVWLPSAGQTARHLFWEAKLLSSQWAVTPI